MKESLTHSEDTTTRNAQAGTLLPSSVDQAAAPLKGIIAPFVCVDMKMKKIFDLARKLAESDMSIVLSGESGTGKEIVARYLHQNSERQQGPFIAINCAAIPENMLEATLFGYEKGAFTGAYQSCAGKFELARSGTLLLDEISEMPLNLQVKILRVLQEKEVERLGGKKPIPLDVRIIATTNKDLKEEVKAARFREDLFYRLNVFPLVIPPLRLRQDDILPLAFHFVRRYAKTEESPALFFSKTATEFLLSYRWPGNVRELENLIQRALLLKSNPCIEAEDFMPDEISDSQYNDFTETVLVQTLPTDQTLGKWQEKNEAQLIYKTLEELGGSRQKTAERLGISPRTLRYKLARERQNAVVQFNVDKKDYRQGYTGDVL